MSTPTPPPLPAWARQVIQLYESNAANQFILHGNVHDRFLLPFPDRLALGNLSHFLQRVLMPHFDILFSYDLGNGLRVETGGEHFSKWPGFNPANELPATPRACIQLLSRFFRYTSNLVSLKQRPPQVSCCIRSAELILPSQVSSLQQDINAMAVMIREWSLDDTFLRTPLAVCLITENLHDLHPILTRNPRTASIHIPLPTPEELAAALTHFQPLYPNALSAFASDLHPLARRLTGSTLSSVEATLKQHHHAADPLTAHSLTLLRRQLVEKDSHGLIEFLQSDKTLADFHAQEAMQQRLRDDLTLWREGDPHAAPMGYLICGPVGTGKTYLVECLAGEAHVPIVKIKNFRDRWIGSSESNLEKIFHLLESLGRCIVFVDEADQTLGQRQASSSDGGLSGRIYSMFATQMSDWRNRGRILWILASSRPDLIEVDLKRPGRIDVKIPIFPTTDPDQSAVLLHALCTKLAIPLPKSEFTAHREILPTLLTAGAAEALALKIYRLIHAQKLAPEQALRAALSNYQHPLPLSVLHSQMALAVAEATDIEFVPPQFRHLKEQNATPA